MNVFQVVETAAGIAGALNAAGVKIPPAVTETIAAAVPVIGQVASGLAVTPTNPSQEVTNLVEAGLKIVATGIPTADSAIESLLSTISQFKSQVTLYKQGQPIVLLKTKVSVDGVLHTSYNVEFLDTSELTKYIGEA